MLNKEFLKELFKLCLFNVNILDVCREHLEFHYLPSEPYKELWKAIKSRYILDNKPTTFGVLSQIFNNNGEISALLAEIKETDYADETDILTELQSYLEDSIYVDFSNTFVNNWTSGKKDEAKKIFKLTQEKLNNFSIRKETRYFTDVVGGFAERQIKRGLTKNDQSHLKINTVFGIDELDEKFDGGLRITDMALILAQSGVGKSTFLRHVGLANARRGFKVLHIQLEGAKEEAELAYDTLLTGQKSYTLEFDSLTDEIYQGTIDALELISYYGGEIKLESYEQFGTASLLDVVARLEDFIKIYGYPPDLILIDYFELLDPGNGKHYSTGVEGEKARRTAIGRGLKSICTKYKTRIVVPTQGSTITPIEKNNPDFHQTRFNISGDKAQLDPFTYFITVNQTEDEYNEGKIRLWVDKARKVRTNFCVQIFSDYEHGRFYDRVRTMREIHGELL